MDQRLIFQACCMTNSPLLFSSRLHISQSQWFFMTKWGYEKLNSYKVPSSQPLKKPTTYLISLIFKHKLIVKKSLKVSKSEETEKQSVVFQWWFNDGPTDSAKRRKCLSEHFVINCPKFFQKSHIAKRSIRPSSITLFCKQMSKSSAQH